MENSNRNPNQLIHANSPYLLQHAYNPVQWREWGPSAFYSAREQNKPIFLSIGYAACHWCHVMAHESFENEQIARILNEHFIPIKVDREERPDVDDRYMLAVQLLTEQGGWPMSVFLTPDLEPFFCGAYFPPEAFEALLIRLVELWNTERDMLERQASDIVNAMNESQKHRKGRKIAIELSYAAERQLEKRFDGEFGGFGTAPKFPEAPRLMFLIQRYCRTRDERLLRMLTTTLDGMMMGGIYDQLGGGFHRYSVDNYWLIPHFEKMLYDQAQLALVYLHASELTENSLYREIALRTLDFVKRDLMNEQGGFYSSLDADSEGEEGAYYLWSPEEIASALGETDGATFCELFSIKPGGNFSGKSILHLSAKAYEQLSFSPNSFYERINPWRDTLLSIRSQRAKPALDDKTIAGWNGLMIAAFAKAGHLAHCKKYTETAVRAAEFVMKEMIAEGKLMRVWRQGKTTVNGFLEDYAYTAYGLLALDEPEWDDKALAIIDVMLQEFWDDQDGGFITHVGDAMPVKKMKTAEDGALPSANGIAAQVLALVNRMYDNRYQSELDLTLTAFGETAAMNPSYYTSLLIAADVACLPKATTATAGPLQVGIAPLSLEIMKGESASIRVHITIAKGWHIGAHEADAGVIPTLITAELPIAWSATVVYPEYETTSDGMKVYQNSVFAELTITAPKDASNALVMIAVRAQACNDAVCQEPVELKLNLPIIVQ